ncbi:MAG: response regulator [Actinomycetes bacterium]
MHFEGSLPASLAHSPDQAQDRPVPVQILLADDDADLRALARQLLDFELIGVDHIIAEAATGSEALIACSRSPVDVLVLDLHIHGFDGLNVLEHVLNLPDRPQVVAWSSDELALRRAVDLGADVTVRKGDDATSLVAAVQRCLRAVQAG